MVAEDVAQADTVRVSGAVTNGGQFGLGDQAGALAVLVADDQPGRVEAAAMTASATSTLMSSQTCGPAASMTSTTVLCTGVAPSGRPCI